MADFQVIRRKSKSAPAEQDLTQDDQSSLLSKAGAGAMSGLHTVGSILSWPSRLVHGAINAAVGGKEGFGENYFNPFDSRGGVEGSRHLINAGILAENNPNEWEWGDLGRGVADLALDPTTYMGPGLTKIGRAAEKGGTLAAGRIAQTANKQRALLNVGLPFADPIVSIGTGAGTVKALQDIGKYSGLTRATKAVKESFPARAMGALFDARKQGLMQKTAQQEAMKATDELRKLQTASRGDINRAIRTDDLAKMHQDDLRMGLEGAEKSAVQGGYVPHPSAADDALEPHVMIHINPQGKINEHFADAAHNGLLDEAIQAGQPINAPLMHLDETGKPVLGKGAVNLKSNKIKDLAKQAFDEEMAALAKKTEDLPMWADDTAKAIHPERQKIIDEAKALEKNRAARLQEHAARIAKELQDASTPDEAIATLAKMRDLKEPNMAVMVPQSQAEQIRRQFAGGERTRNVSENTQRVRASKEYEHLTAADKEMLDRQRRTGFGMGEELHDPTIEHFPRRESVTAAKQETGDVAQRGTAVMPANLPEDAKRKWFLTGNYEGTIGTNKILKDPVLHDAAAEGVDAVEAALRQRHGHLINGLYQDPKQRAAVARTLKAKNTIESRIVANEQKISDMMSNSALQAARQSTDPATIKEVAKYDRKIAKTQAKIDKYKELHQQVAAAHEEALHAGHDRIPALAKYIVDNPDMKGVDKFGNHPFVDYATARQNSDRKYAMTKAFHSIVSKELNKGDGLVTVGQLLKDKGFKIRTAAEQIAGREFENAADLKAFLNENTIDSKLAAELKAIAPSYKAPAAANEVADKFKSSMAWWKGLTLAFPASRVRDAVGGVVQNVLHGWAKPSFLTEDARLLLTGKIVKRNYSHVPEIQEWLAKTGKEWSPENQTEALRQLVATYLPSDHNILADVPTGQVGAGLDQLAHNIPGTQQTTMFNQFIGDPLRALAGKDPGGATWLGTAQPGETMLGKVARAAKQITNVRGVGDAAETMFAPVKASEIVAANSDAYNRAAPFMQQIHGGTKAEVAANKVNRAQIDYSPDSFTATERAIKNYIAPFYSFNSRILPETARELSNFGSPTSQLIKTIDRAHGGGDASVPDYVMSGTGIPLGTRADGSKSYLTGLGQMYEPAVSQLGLLAGGITDPRSLRAAGFDTLAQLNPMLGTPLQRITGQSFFQRGEPISNMDPIAGRLMSNIGESLGLRAPDEGPVKFPGSGYVDTVLGATPFGRAAAQVRTLADPRKDIVSKMVDTLSGARVTDISPEKQMATLQKRAEDLARSQGAWEQRTVGFPKEQLAKLALTNPELAAEQQHLQNMITMMKRKRTIHRKQKKAAEKK